MNELQRLWDNAWNAAQERQWLYGRLGFIGDAGGTITLQVPHRKDFVYVRMGFAGDRGVDIARRRPGVQLRPNLPVKMRRENGVLVIYEADYALMENDPNDSLDESGITTHYHEFVKLSDAPSTYVGQTGKIVAVNATEDALEFVDHVAPDPLLINTIQAKTASGITFLDSNLNEMLKLTDDNTLEIPGEFATINFTGTPGGDDEGITYLDSFSALRFGLLFPGFDIVALANRASNGVVQIRANDATAGELGETTAAIFEHDQIQLLPSGGNVGIGASAPGYPLHIQGSAAVMLTLDRTGAIAPGQGFFSRGQNAGGTGLTSLAFTSSDSIVLIAGTGSQIAFVANGAERVRIDNNGNVGIGTVPSYPFHLDYPDNIADGILARYRGRRDANNMAVQYYHDGVANVANKMSLALLLETSTTVRTAFNIATSFNNVTDASRTSLVEFNTAANGVFGPAMTLVGNLLGVGGATNPLGALHVDQDSATAARPVLILDQADVSEEFIEFDSAVGAGNPIDQVALGSFYGRVRVSVNGTFKYLALYNP